MKRRRKRREGWSIAGDWKLKRRDLASPASEASRSGVTGVWSVAIWASSAPESSQLGVTGVWIVTIGSWDDAGKLKRRDSVWIVVKVNRQQQRAESTAAMAGEASPESRSVAGAKEGEASPVTWTMDISVRTVGIDV